MAHFLSAEDRMDIQEVFARYAWGLNTGDLEAIMRTFAPDSVFDHQPEGTFYGEDKRRMFHHLWTAKAGWFIGRQHLATHFIYDDAGDGKVRVQAYSSILQHNIEYKNQFVFGLANWDCIMRKDEIGDWKFERMIVVKWLNDTLPWTGPAEARLTVPSIAGTPAEQIPAAVL